MTELLSSEGTQQEPSSCVTSLHVIKKLPDPFRDEAIAAALCISDFCKVKIPNYSAQDACNMLCAAVSLLPEDRRL